MPDPVAVCRDLVADLQSELTDLHVHIVRAVDGETELLEHAGRRVASLLERVQAAAVDLEGTPPKAPATTTVVIDGKVAAEAVAKAPASKTAKR